MIFSSEYPKDSQAHHLYRHWSVFERYGEFSFIYKRSIFSYFTGYFFLAILGMMVYRYILGDFEWKYSFILLFPSILLFSEIMTNLPYSIILDDYELKLGNKDKIKWTEIEKVEGFHVGDDSIKLVITLKNSQIIKYNYQEKDNTPYLYIKAYHEKYSK